MTLARRLGFAALVTAAGVAGLARWVDDGIARACACIGRGPGAWREVDDLLLSPDPWR